MAKREPVEAIGAETDEIEPHRLVAETVGTIFWLADWRTERVAYLNPAFETVTGRPREILYEKPGSWIEFVDPEHREGLAADLARRERFVRTVRIFRPDGEARWVRVSGEPVRDAAGVVTQLAGSGEDITERRARGLAVRAVRDAYQALADNVTDLISRHDLQGHVLYASRSVMRVLGYEPEKVFGVQPGQWVDEADALGMREMVERLERSGEPETVEFRIRHRDGGVRWLQASCRLIRDGRGAPLEILAVSRDVTEQRRAAAALAESEERFRQLAENIHQVFWIVDWKRQRLEYVSPAYEKIWGRRIEAVHDQSHRWREALHPDDQERVARAFFAGVAQGDFDVEYRVVRPDGGVRWIRDRGFPVRDARGEVYRIVGIAEDVTEARRNLEALGESEERFRQLAHHLGGMFWLSDWKTGRMVYQSGEIACLRNSAPTGEAHAWLRDVHPEDRDRAFAGLRRLGSEGAFEDVFRVFAKDGSVRWVRSQGFAVRNEDGEIGRCAGWVEDVTERRELETRVQQTQKLESLGVLAGGIAHDFNNLLTGILGNAGLVIEQLPAGVPQRAMVEEIEHAARRAAGLCSQMLAYSGRTALEMGPVELNAVVRDIVSLLRASLRGIGVGYALDPALPMLRGDTNQLGQIVLNLLTNAAESLGAGTGSIHVATGVTHADADTLRSSYLKQELPAGPYVYLEVRDSGCGMDAETRAKLFEPFFTTKFTGRGLGLAAVLGIVRSHAGAIFLDSQPGRGTCFRLLFPVHAGRARPASPANEAPRAIPRDATILVIDDEALVARMAERILGGVGYRVLRARSGEEGLVCHSRHSDEIAAVLLDLTMPDLSGEAVLAVLRERAPALPVVLMSGYTESELGGSIRELGYASFLHKPFVGSALVSRIDHALEVDERGP